MELKDFVSKVLTELDEALLDTSKKFKTYNYKYWRNSSWNPTIDFEVQVYASDWKATEWWLWINVAWFKVWAGWESTKSNSELSKISFSIVREENINNEYFETETWIPDLHPY